eukprot:TRINITY_DN69393_c0_g1_i1.p1 TRINITY_DN69393_c0_g1~~TRINITY_DN69393_c0_g1_i1.p1  ORF type:complete len:334 (-),score=29.02 TRINITY_DN69393_c0_g1_i1:406-1407(-)
MSTVFCRNSSGRTLSIGPVDLRTARVQDLMDLLEAKEEGLNRSEYRLIFAGKALQAEMLTSEYDIQKDSTLFMVFRLLGGTDLPVGLGTQSDIVLSELASAFSDANPVENECLVCNETVPCIRFCCAPAICAQCFGGHLTAKGFPMQLSCLMSAATHPPVDLRIAFRGTVFAKALEALHELRKVVQAVDVNLCECGALLLNETMFSCQTCPQCKATKCFFCQMPWNSKMNNQKFWCGKTCSFWNGFQAQLTPFLMEHGSLTEIPQWRVCPKCATVGAYDMKCKFHTCTCGHAFCFWCLKPERGPDACGTAYFVKCAPNHVQQTPDMLPRLLRP